MTPETTVAKNGAILRLTVTVAGVVAVSALVFSAGMAYARFLLIDPRLDLIEGRLNVIESRLAIIDGKLDLLRQDVNKLKKE